MRRLIDLVRGALIGAAEVVPGVSGGTIALVVGIYATLISQAALLIRGVLILFRGHDGPESRIAASWAQIKSARWGVLIPVALGSATATIVGAALLEPLLGEYPIQTRALFSGLVIAGLIVPYQMVRQTHQGDWRLSDYALALVGVAGAFILTGLPPGNIADPSPLLIVGSAALAVSALVLPGVSGSFLLLSFGMYEVTLAAVNNRDFGYLSLFALGALIGLSTFVLVLQWLLANKARVTLVIITGLMAGSLRALWPWQTEDRTLLAPDQAVSSAALLFFLGFAIVTTLLALEMRFRHHLTDEPVEVPQESPKSASE